MKKKWMAGILGAWAVTAGICGCTKRAAPVVFSSTYGQQETVCTTEDDALRAEEDGGASNGTRSVNGDETTGRVQPVNQTEAVRMIAVDIDGAVACPGVYEIEEGARICDALELAGGLLEDADTNSLNRAQILCDEEKIRVLTKKEAAQLAVENTLSRADTEPGGGQASAKVNINTADSAALCTLSGIGESRAQDIIEYRKTNGAFQSIEDIMNVSGIKEATFQKIKDEIAVR